MKILYSLISGWLVLVSMTSCMNRGSTVGNQVSSLSKKTGASPPAYVQKAWDAKYIYDEEKRLLIPKYAGSKWGSIKEYREDGQLAYQDWWVRDVKVEDLDATPETQMSNLIDEENPLPSTDEGSDVVENVETEPDSAPEEQSVPVEDFVPSPFSPF